MKKKPVSGILFFSLLTLAVCNNVKTTELEKTKPSKFSKLPKVTFVSPGKYKNIINENTDLRETLSRTNEAYMKTNNELKDCQSSKNPILTALTECKERSTTQENQLEQTIQKWQKAEKELKKSEELLDEKCKEYAKINTKLTKSLPLLTLLEKYKTLGTPKEIKRRLASISRGFEATVESTVEATAEELLDQVVWNTGQLNSEMDQLTEEYFVLKRAFSSLQARQDDLEKKYCKLLDETEEEVD